MTRQPPSRPHRHWMIVGPYVLVVLVAFGGVFGGIHFYKHDQCVQERNRTEQLRDIVEKATAPPTAAAPLDLTKADGFNDLDPNTQAWARGVQKMIASRPSDAPTLRDTLLAVIPPIDC